MTTTGGPDVLHWQEIPAPILTQATHVKVKLQAAGLNPIDTKLRQRGTFYPEQMPAILGCDGAGIVTEVGAEVTHLQPGDEVFFCAGGLGERHTGNYAEYAVVDASLVVPKPPSLSFIEAAAAPLVLITAWEALYDRGRLEAGQTVLIHAGAGGVGHVAIQLAKRRGARVLTTVGTPDKARLVRQLGADEPILYRQVNLRDTVLSLTQGQGVDLALDTVGGLTFFETIPLVKVYGDLVTILEPNYELGTLKEARSRNLRLGFTLMLTPALLGLPVALAQQRQILEHCADWLEQGQLSIHVGQTFPLAEAAAAHRALEAGHSTGKIVLEIPGESVSSSSS
ncbi:zinc-binding oxidoreductase [Synechocystis sp. LKSZ1]